VQSSSRLSAGQSLFLFHGGWAFRPVRYLELQFHDELEGADGGVAVVVLFFVRQCFVGDEARVGLLLVIALCSVRPSLADADPGLSSFPSSLHFLLYPQLDFVEVTFARKNMSELNSSLT